MFSKMFLNLPIVLSITLVSSINQISCEQCIVNDFEKVAQALKCQKIILENLAVPAGVTLKLNLAEGAELIFRGNTSFGFKNWDGPLVTINGTNVTVRGEPHAIIDGSGQSYWDGQGGWSDRKPQFFTIQAFGGSVFKDIRVINSPKDVVQVTNSDDVIFDNWLIDDYDGDVGVAPGGREGHNTDGIDVWNSTNVQISNSKIYNQDDCVALRCGANIKIVNLYCHGSHGLSISVGFSNDSAKLNTISNVSFIDSIMERGRNGIHIKTHVDGGFGNITGVLFRNITLEGPTFYGILIEQNYQNKPPPPPGAFADSVKPRNNVPIRDLVLEDVVGSVGRKAVPVHIVCAKDGCFNWKWSNVNVTGRKRNSCNYIPNGFVC